MKLFIEDGAGWKTVVPVVRDEITIGRQEGNTVRLLERNVSRRHARLFRENGRLLIQDLDSFNGIRVNGRKIRAPTAIKEGDLVEVADYELTLQGNLDAASRDAAEVAHPISLPEPIQQADPVARGSGDVPSTGEVAKPLHPEARELGRGEMPRLVPHSRTAKPVVNRASAARIAAMVVVLLGILAVTSWFFRRRPSGQGRFSDEARHADVPPRAADAPAAVPPAQGPTAVAAKPAQPLTPPAAKPAPPLEQHAPVSTNPAPPGESAAPTAANAAPDNRARAENKEGAATSLAKSSNEKLNAHDFEGAVKDAQAALELSPQDRDTLCTAYHSLGYGYSYLNDNASAKKYLEQLKPCCAKFGEATCAQVDEFLSR
jgi:predicted component of type VI protein secretion system